MLRMKITDIQSNGFFLSSKNTLSSDDSLINIFWIIMTFGLVTGIGLSNVLYLFLFALSTKVLSNLDDLNKETQNNLLLNLVKFWSFNYLIDGFLKLSNYFCGNIVTSIVQVFVSIYLIKVSYNWFETNNMLVKDSEKSGYLMGSITIADKLLSKLYSINSLVLNYLLNFGTFLGSKTYHSFDIFKKLFKKNQKNDNKEHVDKENIKVEYKENLIEKEPVDNIDYEKLLDSITEESLNKVHNPNLDSLDDDDYDLD